MNRNKQPTTPLVGKFRGKVVNNLDPLFMGRLTVELAIEPDMQCNWCMPCLPYAGPEERRSAIPPVGTNVWVEFEGGDVNFPIWSGCFWSEGDWLKSTRAEPPNDAA